jgi:hypothetical protein
MSQINSVEKISVTALEGVPENIPFLVVIPPFV